MSAARLVHAEQQMLMSRPWHAAESDSIWEITGDYPQGKGHFTRCLAMVLPTELTNGKPIFKMLGALGGGNDLFDVVGAAQITHARPLLLVLRDEPGTAYWPDDQPLIDGATR